MSDFLLALAAELDRGPEMPPDLLAAIEDGELTQEQLRRLIEWEAGRMGLSFEEAVQQAEDGTLPRTVLGSDVDLLLRMLDREPPPDSSGTAPPVEGGRGR